MVLRKGVVEGEALPTHEEGKKEGGGLGVWPGKRTWCNHRAAAPEHGSIGFVGPVGSVGEDSQTGTARPTP